MNEYIQENKRSLYVIVGLLFILAIVLFFLVLRPVMTDLDKQKKLNDTKEANIELLKIQLENMKKQFEEEDPEKLVLEGKIPPERNIDEYIRSLQALENKTNSEISNITFVYDSNIDVVETEEEEPEVDHEEIIVGKPDELQVIVVQFTATSPSYDDFINLLKTIEQEERISIVSNLQFNQNASIGETQENEEDEMVSFTIHLTTFYYED